MNRYFHIILIVTMAVAVGLGCPAGRADTDTDTGTGMHQVTTSESGGDAQHYSIPSGHNPATTGEPVGEISEPLVSSREAVWFADDVLFTAKVSPVGIRGTVAVLLGDEETCIANLNDIGWPPDEVTQDGIWAGALVWQRVPAPGKGQQFVFAYQRDGKTLTRIPAGKIDLVEDAVEFTAFSCTPSGEVRLADDLVFEAVMSRADLPGKVRVVFDTGQEVALSNETSTGMYQQPGVVDTRSQITGDDIYNGKAAVPHDLPVGKAVQLRARYLDSAGAVAATSQPVSITVLQPDTYLVDFICEPNGPVEIGEYIHLKALLNSADEKCKVTVLVDGPGMERPVEAASFDGTEYARGGRRLTGVWEGDFKWPYLMSEIGGEYSVFARITEGGHIISELEAPLLKLLVPQVEIIDVQLSDWPVLDLCQHVRLTARLNKPVRSGGLVLKVNDEKHGGLVDNGVSYGDGRLGYDDITAYDANWIGNFRWYSNPNYLEPGTGQPARVDYVINDQVYATYELEPLTIRDEGVHIESVYFKPSGPIHHGDDVQLVIDLAKTCSEGRITVSLEDGTDICNFGSDLNSSRYVSKLNWKNIPGPGDYGPVIVTLQYHLKTVSTFAGDPLVVLAAREEAAPGD